LISSKGLSIQKASVAIERTEGWFHNAVKNDTMSVSDLEKLLKLCKTTMGVFFGGPAPETQLLSETIAEYGKLNNEVNELLRENRQLRIKIDELEGKSQNHMAIVKPKT